jgi:hypothetical protein
MVEAARARAVKVPRSVIGHTKPEIMVINLVSENGRTLHQNRQSRPATRISHRDQRLLKMKNAANLSLRFPVNPGQVLATPKAWQSTIAV